MASNKIDKILEIYKELAQNPSLRSAEIISATKVGTVVQCVWFQRNLERFKKQKFTKEVSFDLNLQFVTESFPVDVSSEILRVTSKDGNLKAILREITVDGKQNQYIEIWDTKHLIKSYDLLAYDAHGKVYSDNIFSSFYFSPDNTQLLYIAEKKLPKSEPFYKQKSKNKTKTDEEEPSRGTEYIFKPDWGEQLVNCHRSVIVILNINKNTVTPVDHIPDDYFPAQVIWAPNGEDLVGIAYKLYPRYLGVQFCTNRESYVFHLQRIDQFRKLTGEGLSCKSPRFSPNGNILIWLERNVTPPHGDTLRLMGIKWDVLGSPDIIIDRVNTHISISNDKQFYGIYIQNLPNNCWSEDSKNIFFSTPQRSTLKSYVFNLETKVLTEIENPNGGSLTILDVKKNHVVFTRSTPILPSQIVIGKFDSTLTNVGNLCLNYVKPYNVSICEKLFYENTEYIYDTSDTVKDFNFTYLGEKDGPQKSVPLIATPHGGPHSAFSNEFNLSHALFALLGFGVLQINYRGSTGMGADNIEFLLGKVGETDVLDCVTAVNCALNKYPWLNSEKVSLMGGSHGGFLSAHLSGQHPDMFKAVVMRNPVIDVAAMFSISDIPDWCSGETGNSNLGKVPETTPDSNYSELIHKMLSHSPILYADKVKAPTLIALGINDLRVPSSQGKLWYYRLRANNVITKLHVYEDNHSLAKDKVEFDFAINTALWLLEYASDKVIC